MCIFYVYGLQNYLFLKILSALSFVVLQAESTIYFSPMASPWVTKIGIPIAP